MKNFATDEALDTPYRRAKTEWDSRLGSVRNQAYNWRLVAFVSLMLAIVSTGGLIYQSAKASVIPYIVEVDGSGKVRLVGTPQTQGWTPNESVKRYFVEGWLHQVRDLSSDRQVVRQNWLDAYKAVTVTAKATLDTYAQETKPFERLGKETRTIEIKSMTRASEDTMRVEWRESIFDKSGYKARDEVWVGLVKLQVQKPRNTQELESNPLGIFVDHISWSRQQEMGTGQ